MRRRFAGALCVVGLMVVVLGSLAGSAFGLSNPPTPVQVTFSATGTATIDQHYSGNGGSCGTHDVITLSWVSTFNTVIQDGVLQGTAVGALGGPGPGNMAVTESGLCAQSPVGGSCTAGLSPGNGTPSLTVSGRDPARLEAQSLPASMSFAGCGGAAQAPFAGSDLSVLEASLPGSTTGVVNIPNGSFASTDTITVPVSSADAPDHIASACLGVGRHGTGNDSCSASMSWTGQVVVKPQSCGGPKVKSVVAKDLTTGESQEIPRAGWNAYGITSNEVQPGETIGYGQLKGNEQVTIEFDDESPGQFGTMWTIGPTQEIHVPADCADQFRSQGRYGINILTFDQSNPGHAPHDSFFFFQPNVFASDGSWEIFDPVAHVSAPCNCSRGAVDRAAGGLAPAALTISHPASGGMIVHMIQGTAAVTLPSGRRYVVTAGNTVLVNAGRVQAIDSPPASALSLVPASQRPPTVSKLAVARIKAGKLPIRFRLDQNAMVLAQLVFRGRVIATKVLNARRGLATLTFARKRWTHGGYQLKLTAQRSGRVSILTGKFRL